MSQSTVLIPRQRPAERPCPIGCHADHYGELPGERSHSAPIANIRTADGMLCVTLTVRDGEQPEVLLHDEDGNEVRIPEYVVVAVSEAIASSAPSLWTAA